ncbi:MAG: DUF3466 family protein [Armatimonadetes bacterium]|nr:DUF3466 family protein [Armatimonadota bacterium]
MKRISATLILLFLATLPGARAAQYAVAELGVLPGYDSSIPVALNNHGEVVGYSLTAGSSGQAHSFLYSGGVMTDLNTLTGANVAVYDINDSGVIVGSLTHYAPDGQCARYTAFVWDPAEGLNDLDALSPNGVSYAVAINNNGEVTGDSDSRGFIWNRTSGMRAIPTFGGGFGEAYDVNSQGLVVGIAQSPDDQLPFAYDGSTFIDLTGELGAHSRPYRINDSGQIAGILYPGHAFLWSEAVGMHYLGSLDEGDYYDSISGLNNSGQIVGTYQHYSGAGGPIPFLYSDGQLTRVADLLPADSGWPAIYGVGGINNHGQILAYGYVNGKSHAFIMTPVPEPTSLLALAGGVAGLGGLALKRRRA